MTRLQTRPFKRNKIGSPRTFIPTLDHLSKGKITGDKKTPEIICKKKTNKGLTPWVHSAFMVSHNSQ